MDEVKRLYLEEQQSLGEISKALGPSIQTLSLWLRQEGIPLAARPRNPNSGRTPEEQAEISRRISESQRQRLASGGNPGGRSRAHERVQRSCANPGCEATFEVLDNSPQRFCSRSCARTIGNSERWSTTRKETTCPCGEVFYSPYPKKYCSDECRAEYGQKRQPDPANYVTFTCQTCGKEVNRRRKQGYQKFCSNECAAKHTKTKKHYMARDTDVVLDSGWEMLFYGLCMFKKVPCDRVDRSQAIEYTPGHWYAPDFYLPSLGVYVEVKGLEDEDDPVKWASWPSLVILDRDRLDVLLLNGPECLLDWVGPPAMSALSAPKG